MNYFIMLHHPNGHPMPIVDEDDNVQLFPSEDDADECATHHGTAQAWGYEIYPWEG